MTTTRREFIRKSSVAGMASYMGALGFTASSYRRIPGANDRVRVGVVGFSDRHRNDHIPAFMRSYQEMNFDIIAVSDIWKKRREEGKDFLGQKMGHPVQACMNNEELYGIKEVDAVIISTADFQHALHTVEAVKAGRDTYT
jgi:predicted dehydrogenase